jgi:hypothetical protein
MTNSGTMTSAFHGPMAPAVNEIRALRPDYATKENPLPENFRQGIDR